MLLIDIMLVNILLISNPPFAHNPRRTSWDSWLVPYRVCFVCLGNICRSPMADVVMRAFVRDAGLEDRLEVSSAGTGDWHIGGPADQRAVAALARRGYDGTAHQARQFTGSWFAVHDLVLALDGANLATLHEIAAPEQRAKVRLLREFDSQAGSDLDVPDPYYGGSGSFDEVLDMVERSCHGLLDYLHRELRE
jgi:protein-tyrosine phosphatase